jgi:Tfp pilus assembly protein FimT
VELLVILAIVAILAIGSSLMLGNKQSGSVRALLDELEGTISNAHQAAIATGRDIALVSWGIWKAPDETGNPTNPLRIAFGDASLTQGAGSSTNFIRIGNAILSGNPPSENNSILADGEIPVETEQTVAVPFYYSPSDSVQKKACIVVEGDSRWDTAKGDKNKDIGEIDIVIPMNEILQSENNFCQGDNKDISQVYISGRTKRFSKSVFIKVVGLGSNGRALANGPMGLIVLLENSATVFKFYNSGADNGGGEWRRI